jgi:hypothetical protein
MPTGSLEIQCRPSGEYRLVAFNNVISRVTGTHLVVDTLPTAVENVEVIDADMFVRHNINRISEGFPNVFPGRRHPW